MSKKIDRTGEVSYTKYGTPAVIVEYKNNKEVLIEFQDEYKYQYTTSYSHFKNKAICNPYDKSMFNKGFIGVGKYNTSRNNKDVHRCYHIWIHILDRCYGNTNNKRHESYKDCEVCEEWFCFQNFAEWYMSNLYKINDEVLCIDKDILSHGNKIYCPEKCILTPNRINSLFAKSGAIRGDLPIGVSRYWHDNNRYLASMKIGNNRNYSIGIYNSVDEAFQAYKIEKEKLIKKIAEDYKDKIPKKLYDALCAYEVLITD